ncbi:MAG: tyrosine-type recombinase/integrase [Polyangiales bacterium]
MTRNRIFESGLAASFSTFLDEKRALGLRYTTEEHALRALDHHLAGVGHRVSSLPREIVDAWAGKRVHESARTHATRVAIVRQFSRFLRRNGIDAHVPPSLGSPIARLQFTPRIFSRVEVDRVLTASLRLPPDGRAPHRHLIMPELFRVLYSCGLRCGEALRLRVGDVDLEAGVLTIRQGKFRKDRLVPVADSLLARLRVYAATMGERPITAVFFPAPHGGSYSLHTPYTTFRRLLRAAGIAHGGRGLGPRVHDLRHTFAVHRLEAWYRAGADLGAKLPLLSAYMGHESIAATQRYLRLTPELFPDLASRMELSMGKWIPRPEETT